jgi:O-antigen ligase
MIRTSYILAFAVAAMMAVGRVYDDRLSFAGLNVSLFISVAFAAVLALGAAGLVGAPRRGANGRPDTASVFYVGPLVVLGVWLAVNFVAVPANDPVYAAEKLATFALISLPACLLVVRQGERALNAVVLSLACVGGLMILVSLPSIVGALWGDAGHGRAAQRLSLFGGGPIVYARWVLTGALVVALSRLPLAIKVVAVAVALLAALLAQSKGPVVFFALSLGFVALLHAVIQRRLLRAAGIVLAGAAFTAAAPRIIEAIGLGGRLLTLFDPAELLQQTSSVARVDVLRVSAAMILDHPLGVGLGNWGSAAEAYVISGRDLDYPHNVFVEVAAELGLVVGLGLALWVALMAGSSARRVARLVMLDPGAARLAVLVLALFTFHLLCSLVSGDLSDARLMFLTLGMLVASTMTSRTAVVPARVAMRQVPG